MRGLTFLLVVFALAVSASPIRADDSGGTPPRCDSARTTEALKRVIATLQRDRVNEHVVFLDCLTNLVILDSANGGPYSTTFSITQMQSTNEMMIIYHPVGGDTMRIEDMVLVRNDNPLVVYVIAYDLEKRAWAACMFSKASWDGYWPEIKVNAAYTEYQTYYVTQTGTFYRRTVDGYKAFWHAWTTRNGVGFSCTSDT